MTVNTFESLNKFLSFKQIEKQGNRYICPNCKNKLNKDIILKDYKPLYCYRCGQLLSCLDK